MNNINKTAGHSGFFACMINRPALTLPEYAAVRGKIVDFSGRDEPDNTVEKLVHKILSSFCNISVFL
jgi:hypothetical protein